MKNFCIFLIKVNRWWYLLLGTFIGLLVFTINKDVSNLLPSSDIFRLIFPFTLFGVFFAPLIAKHTFYTKEEIESKEADGFMDSSTSHVFGWDHYFNVKINTELSFTKRFCGYAYAILGPISFVIGGYFLTAITILLVAN